METTSAFETLIATFKAAKCHDFAVRNINNAKMPVFVYYFTKFVMKGKVKLSLCLIS
jgi:hypothetical protein